MNANANQSLAEIAVHHPAASRVFHRHGLDYCCGGRRTLADACQAANLNAEALLAEVASEAPAASDTDWAMRPLDEIIDHIVGHYHARLRVEIPELVAMAEKVENRHADKASCPHGLGAHLRVIHMAVLDHLEKEERILFPMIRAGAGARAAGPVQVMELEHDDHGVNLAKTRTLTTNLEPPVEACTTWRALYLRLAALEEELHEHIHLENNILFPRALGN